MAKTFTAHLRYLHIAPRKVRFLTHLIKAMPVEEAEAQLLLSPRRAGVPLLKLLRSAAANAKSAGIEKQKLFVEGITVDRGPKLKRWMPRARGSVSAIEKKMSHVSLTLRERDTALPARFVIVEKKSQKSEKKPSVKKTKETPREESGKEKKSVPRARTGLLKRIFQRKAV